MYLVGSINLDFLYLRDEYKLTTFKGDKNANKR